jgi:hypothetical protein
MKKLTLSLLSLATASLLSAENVTVQNGWNLLGSPYNIDLEASFKDHADITLAWSYNNSGKEWMAYGNSLSMQSAITSSSYNLVSSVDKLSGFWVKNSGDAITVELVQAPINGISKLSSYNTELEGGSEISSFDRDTKRIYTTNGGDKRVDVVDLSDVTNPTLVTSFDISTYGSGIQSVTVKNGKVAAAVSSDDVNTKGKVLIFETNGTLVKEVEVGYLPDMVTFTEDGSKIVVANEGEPDASTGTYIDVKGSIGVITVANDYSYSEVDFSNATLTDADDGTAVRLGGTPSNSAELDIEPEYIAVSGDSAFVSLQENNALAIVDISGETPVLTAVKSFGKKGYSSENTIDIEEEGEILMKNYPSLFGLYQPDSIASFMVDGKTYLATANEGDGREYCSDEDPKCDDPIFIDEKKISKSDLDPTIADAYADENDLKVMVDLGDTDGDGDYDELYTYGGRSFSIWDSNGDLVWDSGDQISKLVAEYEPTLFNQDDGEMDGRSGNKGAEPEALTVGMVDGKTYAFVGLERQNSILVYDISNPSTPEFVQYYMSEKDGDISPEGMVFVPASESPNGENLLIVSYEVSGSTSIYKVK